MLLVLVIWTFTDCSLAAGMGPYTSVNVMQLLGRYSRVPCDSETKRHLLVCPVLAAHGTTCSC